MKIAPEHIDELIAKQLAGEANALEQEQVEAWINESADNKSYFEDCKIISEEVNKLKVIHDFDGDAAWNKVKDKLNLGGAKTIPLQREPSYFMRIAAAITFLAVAGFAIYLWLSRPLDVVQLATEKNTVSETLPDGSMAFINTGSSLSYSFNQIKQERKLELSGEAYFDVKHEEKKPFIIKTQDVIIEDIGTTFNVKAYPDSSTVEVFVETGEVAFYTVENPGLKLIAGQTGVYDKTTKSFAKFVQSDTNKLAYKTGVFTFHDTDLESVVRSLNSVYEKKIKLKNAALKTCRLNVSFRNESLDDIVDILAETLGLSVTKTENEIILDGKGCSE